MSEGGGGKPATPLVSLITGCISGGIEATCMWPMEYMKTQLQLQSKAHHRLPFTGVWSGLVYTVRTTGFFSLYNGLGVTLFFSIPKAGIRFGGNAWCKKMLADDKGKLTMGKQFLAGMGAGILEAIFAVTPMETIKTKLIEKNLSFVPGMKVLWKEGGIRGLYQGLMATILKQSSNQGLRFMFYNTYKDYMTDHGKSSLSPVASFLGGMGAGCFSVLGNNPFDVVKTRMQGSNAHIYRNTVHCFFTILKEDGLVGMYKGVVPRLGRVVPGQGIIFMSFEAIQGYVSSMLKQ